MFYLYYLSLIRRCCVCASVQFLDMACLQSLLVLANKIQNKVTPASKTSNTEQTNANTKTSVLKISGSQRLHTSFI